MLAKSEPIAAIIADEVRPIAIAPPAKQLAPPIITLDDVTVGYEAGKPVLRRLTLRLDQDDRIALLGANGNGKSTLMKLMAGRLAPLEGRITRADKLEVGYFAQHQLEELDPADSAYDHLRRLMPDAPEATVRGRAGGIGFPGATADTPAGQLSGGEKSRLLLGLATFRGPHLLILDEPTNHLDIDSRAALVAAINAFPGAVVLVSHDRYLIEACAERLWLVGGGGVAPFDGDLDAHRHYVLTASGGTGGSHKQSKIGTSSSRAALRRTAAEKRSELAPLRRRIAAAERIVERLTGEISRIDAALAAPGLFGRDPAAAAALSKSRAETVAALAEAEKEWFAASAELEAAMA